MKRNEKFLTLFILLMISLIVVFLIINNKRIENKIDEHSTHENSLLKNDDKEGENNNMNEFISKINININGTNYTATLEDNNTTREFLKRLPLEINMNELNGNEKYYYFDNSLPNNSSRIGKISSGDLMLYGSDCLVLFYKSFNTSYSYTKIGKIDNLTYLESNVGKDSIKISFTKQI